MYPRSGFRSGGTCERTLVPVFVLGEHPNVPSFRISFRGNIRQNHPFGNHPFGCRVPQKVVIVVVAAVTIYTCFLTSKLASPQSLLIERVYVWRFPQNCRNPHVLT